MNSFCSELIDIFSFLYSPRITSVHHTGYMEDILFETVYRHISKCFAYLFSYNCLCEIITSSELMPKMPRDSITSQISIVTTTAVTTTTTTYATTSNASVNFQSLWDQKSAFKPVIRSLEAAKVSKLFFSQVDLNALQHIQIYTS